MIEGLSGTGGTRLACSMRGLASHAISPSLSARGLIEWIASSGSRGLVIDATHPELRARDLGRSARRDLASTIKRSELAWRGIDVFVPAAHLASPETSERAMAAVLGAVELASELRAIGLDGAPVITLDLPDEPAPGVVSAIASAAERQGVVAACPKEGHTGFKRSLDLDAMGEIGAEIVGALTSAATAQVRWGGPRIERRIDLLDVTGALAIRTTPCVAVLDLSRSADPAHTIEAAITAWMKASPSF